MHRQHKTHIYWSVRGTNWDSMNIHLSLVPWIYPWSVRLITVLTSGINTCSKKKKKLKGKLHRLNIHLNEDPTLLTVKTSWGIVQYRSFKAQLLSYNLLNTMGVGQGDLTIWTTDQLLFVVRETLPWERFSFFLSLMFSIWPHSYCIIMC